MAFEEIKDPTLELMRLKKQYRALENRYGKLKAQFLHDISWENFETMPDDSFTLLKDAYMEKKKVYWEIYELENPHGQACKAAYDFLNSMTAAESISWLQEHNLTTHQLIAKIEENPNFLSEEA